MRQQDIVPTSVYRLLKEPFFGRYQRPWRWPDDVSPSPWARISISGTRGAKLAALCATSRAPRVKGTIVCAHPMFIEAKGYFLKRGHADLLLRNGYNVLAFDFNGFGESETGSFAFPSEVVAAAHAAQRMWPNLPLGVLGASFGGAWAVCAMAEHPALFRAAVIEAAFTTLDEYWVRYRVPYLLLRSMNVVLPRFAARLRPVEQIRKIANTPLMLVYSDVDDVAPPDMGQRLLGALPPENTVSQLWVAHGAEHTKVLPHDPAGYEARVIPFLDRAFATESLGAVRRPRLTRAPD